MQDIWFLLLISAISAQLRLVGDNTIFQTKKISVFIKAYLSFSLSIRVH
jgi:hypothetical protein